MRTFVVTATLLFFILSGNIFAQETTYQRLTEELLTGFEATFVEEMSRFNVPGAAVAIVQGGEIVYAQGFGERNVQTGEPVTTETVFRVGSTTKSMTAMLVATQVGEGLFNWDTPVVDLVPNFSLPGETLTQQVRVHDLMGMGTGLEDGLSYLYWQQPSAQTLFDTLVDSPVIGELGEVFYYNNQVYATAGYLGSLVQGVPYEKLPGAYADLMQKRIYGPIGMKAAITDDPSVVRDNYAVGHETTVIGGATTNVAMPHQPLAAVAPAGGTATDVVSMARYLITQLNEGVAPDGTRLVSAENLARTQMPQTPLPAPANAGVDFEGYAMGWIALNYDGVEIRNHSGGTGGFRTDMLFVPEADLGIVVVTNSFSGQWFSSAMLFELVDSYFGLEGDFTEQRFERYQAHLEDLSTKAESVVSPTVNLESVSALLGEYQRGWRVELRDDTLWVVGNGYNLRLLPTDSKYIANNGGDETGTEFVFGKDTDGTVTMSLSGGADKVQKLATTR
jgi:CubicO group peptidase (beta-lactamase class C family)